MRIPEDPRGTNSMKFVVEDLSTSRVDTIWTAKLKEHGKDLNTIIGMTLACPGAQIA